ncbi:MAG: helix-turn-helix transcriptional regulator [Hyphomicrobium sp.]
MLPLRLWYHCGTRATALGATLIRNGFDNATGVSAGTIKAIEHGQTDPRLATLRRLARTFKSARRRVSV